MRGLNGKAGIIVGAGRGIGAATARRFAEEGASVVVGDYEGEWAESVAASIREGGGRAIGVRVDGTDPASVAAIVQACLDEYDRLDFFCSNLAGGTEGDVDALNCPLEVFDRSVAINARSHLIATQAALPAMLERGGGAFIYTSSGAASGGAPWQVAYPMTKNAIHPLARHVAAKWGRKGIRANVICPGLVLTEAAMQHLTPEYLERGKAATPHVRLGEPKDIAAAIVFLASEDGEWVNGQVWHVNGGTQMRD